MEEKEFIELLRKIGNCDDKEQMQRVIDEHNESQKTVTNADRIRAMSDEELADFFFESPEIEFSVCEYCKNFGGHASPEPCKYYSGRCCVPDKNEAFKKWLKQPAGG